MSLEQVFFGGFRITGVEHQTWHNVDLQSVVTVNGTGEKPYQFSVASNTKYLVAK